MARTTKQLSGGGKDKFLRGVVASVDGLTGDVAERIGAALIDGITEVRVKRDVWDALRVAPEALRDSGQTTRETTAGTARSATAVPVDVTPATTVTFDPFAFSAVAVLTKKGKAALAAALESIDDAVNLKLLAGAQHLSIDPAIGEVSALRAAIIAATERRIAERKAAAS